MEKIKRIILICMILSLFTYVCAVAEGETDFQSDDVIEADIIQEIPSKEDYAENFSEDQNIPYEFENGRYDRQGNDESLSEIPQSRKRDTYGEQDLEMPQRHNREAFDNQNAEMPQKTDKEFFGDTNGDMPQHRRGEMFDRQNGDIPPERTDRMQGGDNWQQNGDLPPMREDGNGGYINPDMSQVQYAQEETKAAGFTGFLKTYQTPIISLILLIFAFIFVKFYKCGIY